MEDLILLLSRAFPVIYTYTYTHANPENRGAYA